MYTLLLGDKYKEVSGIQETAKMIVWGYQKKHQTMKSKGKRNKVRGADHVFTPLFF